MELLSLWDRVGPDPAFVDFCEDHLDAETSFVVRGALEYILAIANGERRTDRDPPPAGLALYEFNKDREAVGWEHVKQFADTAESLPIQQLQEAYFEHLDNSPASLIIRHYALIGAAAQTGCGDSRELQLFAAEADSDRANRQLAVLGLAKSCNVGDLEASEILGRLSLTESDWLYARPAMQSVGSYLRGGPTPN